MTSLQELDLSRCLKVNDAGIKHILSIVNLEKLCIAETGVTAEGVRLLASLKRLSVLDLGGLPVNDMSLNSLQVTFFQYWVDTKMGALFHAPLTPLTYISKILIYFMTDLLHTIDHVLSLNSIFS